MFQYDHIFCLFSKAKARISETMLNHDLLKFQIANPCTSVRVRYSPPIIFNRLLLPGLISSQVFTVFPAWQRFSRNSKSRLLCFEQTKRRGSSIKLLRVSL